MNRITIINIKYMNHVKNNNHETFTYFAKLSYRFNFFAKMYTIYPSRFLGIKYIQFREQHQSILL